MKRILPLILSIVLLSACGHPAVSSSGISTALPDTAEISVPSPPIPAEAPLTPSPEPVPEVSVEPDWLAVYQPVFDCYASLLDCYQGGDVDLEQLNGLRYDLSPNYDLILYSKARLGYSLDDLDGNGIPELIVGLMTDDLFYSNIAASLFTLIDEEPSLVFASMARSRYEYFSEGGFLYEGSGGAAYYDVFVNRYSEGKLYPEYGAFHEGDKGFFLVTAGGKETGISTAIEEGQFYEYTDRLNRLIGSGPVLTMMDIYEG